MQLSKAHFKNLFGSQLIKVRTKSLQNMIHISNKKLCLGFVFIMQNTLNVLNKKRCLEIIRLRSAAFMPAHVRSLVQLGLFIICRKHLVHSLIIIDSCNKASFDPIVIFNGCVCISYCFHCRLSPLCGRCLQSFFVRQRGACGRRC